MYQPVGGSGASSGLIHAPHELANFQFPADRGTETKHRDFCASEQRAHVRTAALAGGSVAVYGASWYKAERKTVSLTEHRMRPGGLIRSVNQGMFEEGGGFSREFASEHINVQEGYALETTLQLFCTDQP